MQHLRKRLCVITVGIGGRRVGSTQAHLFPNPGIDRRDPETDGKTKRRSTVLLITVMAGLYLLAAFDGAPAQGVRTAPLRQPGTHWPRIAFLDGSGSIALPPGWRINNAQRASAALQGPNGEAVAVGITMPVGPQFAAPGVLAALYLLPRQPQRPSSIADFANGLTRILGGTNEDFYNKIDEGVTFLTLFQGINDIDSRL